MEAVDGKAVTTSRKLAQVLGRTHDSVCDTIRENLDSRAFKYGNFTRRAYSGGGKSHGSEFLITRTGLSALAAIMRHGAREKIAAAYAGEWGRPSTPPALPRPDSASGEQETQEDTVAFLARWIDELRDELRAVRETQRQYSDMYRAEKERRKEMQSRTGLWADLYQDLMLNVVEGAPDDMDERLKEHKEFRRRLMNKS